MRTVALAAAFAAAVPGGPVAVVRDVFRPGPAHSELQRIEPATLRPAGPAVRLGGYLRGRARSPDGGRLALGVSDRGRLQIVDVNAGRTAATLRTGRRTAWSLIAWPRADRVLAVGYGSGRSSPLLVADPARRRVLRLARVPGFICASAPTSDGLALLVGPPGRIGEATLVLVDAHGDQRRIALPGVVAGSEAGAGLALRGGSAFIASARDASVVEVDLASGRAVRHPLPGTLAEEREIAFVGPNLLAIADRATGVRVIDTTDWSVHVLAPDAGGFTALPEGGLTHLLRDSPPRGLVVSDGHQSTTVFRHALVQVQYASHYAYVVATRPQHRTWVIDLHTGRVIRTLPTAQPGIVLG